MLGSPEAAANRFGVLRSSALVTDGFLYCGAGRLAAGGGLACCRDGPSPLTARGYPVPTTHIQSAHVHRMYCYESSIEDSES